jgi:hypothetical protein
MARSEFFAGSGLEKNVATGGWEFAQFDDGKPADEAVHKPCFLCKSPQKIATLSSPVTRLNAENHIRRQ